MGGCLSLEEEEARLRSAQIDRQIAQLARQERDVVKILLLGAGESGKSTIVKQMKIIHNDGFSQEELRSFKPTVLDNLLGSMKFVLVGMGTLEIDLERPENKVADRRRGRGGPRARPSPLQAHVRTILSCGRCYDEDSRVLPSVSRALRGLWSDKGVRSAVARGYEYELNDSALYMFENMERICSEKYLPTPRDVLRARVRTNGIIETQFKIDDVVFRMFDVGGQRSERRKWIRCFDDVDALLYVVALSGYDMHLQEDPDVNRLQESLTLFSSVCNNAFFADTATVLFLNKLDLFRDKILYSERHLRHYVPDYKGPDYDVDSGALFVQHRFGSAARGRPVYSHFITATDTSDVRAVFQIAVDAVVRGNLRTAALL